jgi:hypothetical protein
LKCGTKGHETVTYKFLFSFYLVIEEKTETIDLTYSQQINEEMAER